jgi:KDO2-lipid IV(A) lauroyltransferase
MHPPLKMLRYFLEGILAWSFYYLFKLLPLDWASWLGGFIAKKVGLRLKLTETARSNLRHAFPEKSQEEIEAILPAMWENLGRVAGEFAHLPHLVGEHYARRVDIEGTEHVKRIKQSKHGAIFFSAHLGNWEMCPKASYELGMPVTLVYRAANNPFVDSLIKLGRAHSQGGLFPKGKKSARELISVLKEGKSVGMLTDQKMNDGVPVPFFNRDAMTAPAMAELALRYNCLLIPVQVIRTHGAHFKVVVHPQIDINEKQPIEILTEMNVLFEGWIRERPEQWLWMHHRWPKG